jgi:uridine kinase
VRSDSYAFVSILNMTTGAHAVELISLNRGGALERGFRRVINDVPVGSLLIQSDSISGEPLMLQVMLPVCVRLRHRAADAWVFLLDAQVIGSARFKAVRMKLHVF